MGRVEYIHKNTDITELLEEGHQRTNLHIADVKVSEGHVRIGFNDQFLSHRLLVLNWHKGNVYIDWGKARYCSTQIEEQITECSICLDETEAKSLGAKEITHAVEGKQRTRAMATTN